MGPDEIFVAVVCVVLIGAGLQVNSTARMPALYFRSAHGIALTRFATVAAMIWILVVLLNFADPSVTGIYVWFYLLMGYAVVTAIAPAGAHLLGARFRVDVCERRNGAAAVLHAGVVLATGMIFGGCLWGEADPSGDGEGGWWIPVGFFLAGWGILMAALALFFWREPGPTRLRIRRDRQLPEAQAAGTYAITAAWVLTEAVAGDFYGWRHGLLAVGFMGGLLAVRELFAFGQDRVVSGVRRHGRSLESAAYVVTGIVFWIISRSLDGWLAKVA
jgi:hypothetical protein